MVRPYNDQTAGTIQRAYDGSSLLRKCELQGRRQGDSGRSIAAARGASTGPVVKCLLTTKAGLLLTCFVIGCATEGVAPRDKPVAEATGSEGGSAQVFCQMSEEEGRWDCGRMATSAPSPTPERLPEPDSSSLPAPVPMPTDAPQRPPAELPNYQRLAYQPAAPIALVDLPPDLYAVQLLAMSSRSALAAYAAAKGVPELSAAPVERNGTLYYVLLLGIYESLDNAEAAIQDLPAQLADLNPWIRSIGSLQAAMARGAALPRRPEAEPNE